MVTLTEAPCDGTVSRMEVIREEQRRLSAEETSRTNHIHLSSDPVVGVGTGVRHSAATNENTLGCAQSSEVQFVLLTVKK